MLEMGDLLRELAGKGERAALAIVVSARGGGARPGAKAVFDADGKRRGGDAFFSDDAEKRVATEARAAIESGEPRLVELRQDACGADCSVYIEPQRAGPELLVLGSGPVAEALVRIGAACGLAVRVAGRGASAARYPGAATTDDDPSFERLEPPRGDVHVVVATGHEADEEALSKALDGKPASVQFVSSSRRAPKVISSLREAGVPASALGLIRAPAGLDLGAEGPDEIALSIVAEVIRLRRGGSGRPLAEVKGTLSSAPGAVEEARPTLKLATPVPPSAASRPSTGPTGTERGSIIEVEDDEDDFSPGQREEVDDFRSPAPRAPKKQTERYKDAADEEDARPIKPPETEVDEDSFR